MKKKNKWGEGRPLEEGDFLVLEKFREGGRTGGEGKRQAMNNNRVHLWKLGGGMLFF